MKKILTAVSLSALLLSGCSSVTKDKEAIMGEGVKLPSGYDVISSDRIDSNVYVFELVHKKTKKHYSVVCYAGSGVTMYELDGEDK
jgi:PBP1b-binding outer membrane lipoprotein LpoB